MRRRMTVILFALASLAVAFAGQAEAAKTPKVSLVSPMRAPVGSIITIHGSGFSARRINNTVVFLAPTGRAAFAKPRRATSRKLVVRVPGTVAGLISQQEGRQVPTRFRLRVLAGRSSSSYTVRRLSPVILPLGASTQLGG